MHGLPLIGSGDWNDGLNRVGAGGKGESVWLGWFLCDVLNRFAGVCDLRGKFEKAKGYRAQAQEYAASIERYAWDGAWYRRAYFDDGTPVGSHKEEECQIDAIAQPVRDQWGGGPKRSRKAMRSALERLVSSEDRLSILFHAAF